MSAARRKSGGPRQASRGPAKAAMKARGRRGRRRQDEPAGAGLPAEILAPEEETIDSDLLPEDRSTQTDQADDAIGAAATTSLATYDPLRRYIAEIRQYPPLDAAEERELAVRYRSHGDLGAARRLVTANLRLVVKMARMFHRWRLNILDLIQEGNLGLLQAVQRFDPFRGLRLSTYAYWWIKAYILKYVMDHWGLVRIGTTAARRRLLYNLSREQRLLEARGIEAGPRLLAERFGVSEQDIKDVSAGLGQRDLSLDAPVDSEGGGIAFVDALASEGASVEERVAQDQMQELMQHKFREFAAGLDPRDRTILQQRLLASEPMTLEQIGQQFGITREGVRQVERKLLVRLKAFMERELKDRGFSFQLQRHDQRGAPPVDRPSEP